MPSHEIVSTRLIQSVAEARAAVLSAKASGESIGLVPTMGALHQGHLSLVEASLRECDRTVVSIFVNPAQFGPSEDLRRYPRDLDEDLRLLEELGCWLLFAPSADEMYGRGFETYVDVGPVAEPLEGVLRPGHFRGVATVVLKLLQIVPADRTFFGQKDYQQTLVVKQLVNDLGVPTEICVEPIVREADGIALSSRNAYLNPTERKQACALWQSLQLAEQLHAAGEKNAEAILGPVKQQLARADGVDVEYVALLQQGTIGEVSAIKGPTVVVIAARVGQTRLIDNHIIG